MIKLLRTLLCIGVFSFGLLSTANAALEMRLGGLAVYDTDLNITWLSDANYAKTSGYNADGRMEWWQAKAWAENLNVGGVSGWRLPTTDTSCMPLIYCTASEMGHLFYNELGGTEGSSIWFSADPDLALFTNLQIAHYWFGTESPDPGVAWFFGFGDGSQTLDFSYYYLFAWPVHDGDVGLIPEPEIYAMMSIGLLAVFGFGRLRQQS